MTTWSGLNIRRPLVKVSALTYERLCQHCEKSVRFDLTIYKFKVRAGCQCLLTEIPFLLCCRWCFADGEICMSKSLEKLLLQKRFHDNVASLAHLWVKDACHQCLWSGCRGVALSQWEVSGAPRADGVSLCWQTEADQWKALKQNVVARSLTIFPERLCPEAGTTEKTFASHKKFPCISYFQHQFSRKKKTLTPSKQQKCVC